MPWQATGNQTRRRHREREGEAPEALPMEGATRAPVIDPPKWHDVGHLLLEHSTLFSQEVQPMLQELASISKKLRKEREFSFYGSEDFIPTEEYTQEDAEEAIHAAQHVTKAAQKTIPQPSSSPA